VPAGIYLPLHVLLFLFRLPFFVALSATYFLVLQWFPLGSLVKKAFLWMILAVPWIWWVDLQIDGVKKGSLAQTHEGRVPQPPDIIASSFTSPIDSLYLAAIFDPIFTISYPHTRQVEYVSLLGSIRRALSSPKEYPPKGAKLTDLKTLVAEHPRRVIVVFPECTTTNGRGILPFSPSLLTAPPQTKIFPISLRYTPADITTPVPGQYFTFFWNLFSQPTHCIRVRIAQVVYNNPVKPGEVKERKDKYLTNILDTLVESSTGSTIITPEQRRILDTVGEALARLGRVKRVGLTVQDKEDFVEAWSKR
jgi:1-acyl-sn-glycerol-3-phosphate acyltransferase